ncbi:MAG: hypothetical protein K2H99_08295 [Paramuribaculum sp.]|nr:hypothetical protein [Paramuribaculum sp.]
MKRKLLRQTLNEWRTNVWLIMEMIIVSAIVWYINDYLYVHVATRLEPTGFDTSHTYLAEFRYLPSGSPRFIDYGEEATAHNRANLRSIIEAIRQRPDVEEVSLSASAEPYFQNFYGMGLNVADDTTEISIYYRQITPEHLRTIGYQPAEGFTIEQLEEALRQGKPLMTEFDKSSPHVSGHLSSTDLLNRRVKNPLDTSMTITIGGLLKPVKRTNIETTYYINYFEPIDMERINPQPNYKINIRVKPEADNRFLDSFNADRERLYRRGNTYISQIKPYSQVRAEADSDNMVTMRKYVAVMVFMLVSVFLGLLGTFWFRTQQRTAEIAMRKVNGATNASVFRRLISEGLLMLAVATLPALVIDRLICHHELNAMYGAQGYFTAGRFALTVAATALLMALMVIAGIWFPAYKAMRIEPARALADE